MKKFIGNLVFALSGWKLKNDIDVSSIKNSVLACAPHTSNWDFIFAVSAFWKMGIPMKLFIKDDWTKPWYGFIIKWLGGIGVNRSQKNNLTDYAAGLLKDPNQSIYMLTTPEGTRSYAEKWKRGFYYIAKKAEVPIIFGYADYKKKTAGMIGIIDPMENTVEEVLAYAKETFKDITAANPEMFNPDIK